MHRIAVAGHICVDIRPQVSGTAQFDPGKLVEVGPVGIALGGSVWNTGRALTAMGAPVTAFTCVGDDQLGRLVEAELATDVLMRSNPQVVEGASTSYSLILEPAGVDRTIWHHVGANAAFTGAEIDLAGSDLLHLGYPPLLPGLLSNGGEPLHRVLVAARTAGLTASVDLAVLDPASGVAHLDWEQILARMTSQTDVLSPSLDDLTSVLRITEPPSPALAERLADQLLEWGAAVVALSAGPGGLLVKTAGRARLESAGRALARQADSWADRAIHVPAISIDVPVTTNGAGDASTAGLLFGILTEAGAEGAARMAVAFSAAWVGGRPTTPDAVGSLAPEIAHLVTPTTTGTVLVLVPANQPADRFYRGGAQISAFRGEPGRGPRTPEDWIASTTTVRGHRTLGRSRLPDGYLLVDAIERRPLDWLGPEHVEAFGTDTKLLVKLLDSGQRLPIHAHPDAAFAELHLGERHGKAEAWYILTPGEVFLGLVEDMALPRLRAMVEEQDVEGMLRRMHRVPVRPHQTVYVPPGVLHAIGQGILLVEAQEPEDLSILLEWRDFEIDGRAEGHLGLGFDTALQAVETRARTADEVADLIREDSGHGHVLAPESAAFFRLESVSVAGESQVAGGFAIMIIVDGSVAIASQHRRTITARRGATILAPYAAGELQISGHGRVLVARPPLP